MVFLGYGERMDQIVRDAVSSQHLILAQHDGRRDV
jgi:hypothetical protein